MEMAQVEMVNLLLQDSDHQAVIDRENFWNELTDQKKFSLLWAYSNQQFKVSKKRFDV